MPEVKHSQIRRLLRWLLLIALTSGPSWAHAHGSVVDGSDNCIIRLDFYSAHFNVYQPGSRGTRAFCEDLPDAAETVFVVEYLHGTLREVPVEFRLIRNPTTLGRFTRWEDIEPFIQMSDITVFHQRLAPQPDGFLTVMHTFDQPGDYVGIISAPDPVLDNQYIAVFPFEVGQPNSRWWLPGLLLLSGIGWLARRRSTPLLLIAVSTTWLTSNTPAFAQLDITETSAAEWVTQSQPAGLEIRWQSEVSPISLNTLHTWIVEVHDADGVVMVDDIRIDGGMPAHNHGLPTRPLIRYQSGQYRAEGLRFHMPGRWQLTLQMEHDGRLYQTRLEFEL